MAAKQYPTQDVLRKLFRYDPETGRLVWIKSGAEAGRPIKNRTTATGLARLVSFRIGGERVRTSAHRVAWVMTFGIIAQNMVIDHINGDNCDNRLSNMRLATIQQNSRNRRASSNSKSGVIGVRKSGSKWMAQIRPGTVKSIYLGTFATMEMAIAARHAAEIKYYGEFAPCLSRAQ